MGAFHSCQSPRRKEKASQMAKTQMTESTTNAMIFFVRRSRLAIADRPAIILAEIFGVAGLRLDDIVMKHSLWRWCSGAPVVLSQLPEMPSAFK